MNTFNKTTLVAALSLPLLAGCVTPGEDDPNALTKQGAAGGALLGLTMGALTGDADLAVKGAIAGGVAGGVAGAGADIHNNRDNIRHDSRNDAIGAIGGTQNTTNAPQQWQEIDNFVGNWNVNIQNHSRDFKGLNGLSAQGSLAKTTEANVKVTNAQGVDLNAEFTFDAQSGYQLTLTNEAKNVSVAFAGEQQAQTSRYNFYPVNINDVIYQGIPTGDVRVELGFAGPNVWTIDSYAYLDGSEQKVQTFRFTRTQ
ncbi:hypothetical protein ACOMICROBIO_GDFFDHBD_01911 [Vibrio sp. B1REV9]|uniref:hypothetical protein n=1 Tax=Vibrio sp. B1REV9 TaxID=2751179 RepID=UPI001AF48D76|nr:hypothetical protein [Vibrio sp. B1REV9]CAE6919824.1 hypothetical protein ACOMICROBIO_GDFFDHBD_01911 [Vibrio sp. B1REV9]